MTGNRKGKTSQKERNQELAENKSKSRNKRKRQPSRGSMGQKGEVGNDIPCTFAGRVKQVADKRKSETGTLAG